MIARFQPVARPRAVSFVRVAYSAERQHVSARVGAAGRTGARCSAVARRGALRRRWIRLPRQACVNSAMCRQRWVRGKTALSGGGRGAPCGVSALEPSGAACGRLGRALGLQTGSNRGEQRTTTISRGDAHKPQRPPEERLGDRRARRSTEQHAPRSPLGPIGSIESAGAAGERLERRAGARRRPAGASVSLRSGPAPG